MSDWADEKAREWIKGKDDCLSCYDGSPCLSCASKLAAALRAARVEGMKEARELIERYPTSTTDARFQIIGRINARISALESITPKEK